MLGTLGAAANCQKCQDCQSRKRALNPDIQFRTLRKPNYSLLGRGRKVLVQGVVDSIATHEFDCFYMRALYDLAYGIAEEGYTWSKKPPVLIPGSE